MIKDIENLAPIVKIAEDIAKPWKYLSTILSVIIAILLLIITGLTMQTVDVELSAEDLQAAVLEHSMKEGK